MKKIDRDDWQKALEERRVIRWNDGFTLSSYPTLEARDAALRAFEQAGMSAEVVELEGSLPYVLSDP